MVVGDSISHGQEGDYTWRYRLYDWATTQNLEMYYVGPYRGTFPKQQAEPPTPAPRQGQSSPDPVLDFTQGRDYASDIGTGWDTGHFAAWGRQLAQDKGQIRQMVAEYQPDILLVELGFNDMGWWVSDAGGTLSSMDTFVSEARAAKSDVKFAIANVPDRTFIDGRADLVVNTYTYNQNLPGWADGWNQDSSPVVVVDFNGAYSCTSLGGCDAAYDGLHPNAKGEFEIASAFSKGMISLGYGKDALSVPDNIPQRPTSTPEGFDAQSLPFGIQVSVSVTCSVDPLKWSRCAVYANQSHLPVGRGIRCPWIRCPRAMDRDKRLDC